ncbi:MAG TPA: ABC transporter permease [Desulfitobacteriaceae bacterium]|nr:ABC transporter permease [Desulfitobacteriaceae bacterium]
MRDSETKRIGMDKPENLRAYSLKIGAQAFLGKISSMPVMVMLAFVWIVFIIISRNFFTPNNLVTLFVSNSFFFVAAIGETFVLMTGGIDLSIAHVTTVSSIVSALVMIDFQSAAVAAQVNPGTGAKISDPDWWTKITSGQTGVIQQQVTQSMESTALMTILIGLLVCVAVGLVFGLINGIAIGRFRMNPFIITLSTQLIARGISFVLSGGHSIPGIPRQMISLSTNYGIPLTDKLVLPWIVLITILLVVVFGIALDKTRWGRSIKLVGSNPQSARYVGIKVNNVTTSVYVVSGLIGGLAGFISMTTLGTADVKLGDPLLLPIIGSVVLGGISLAGGEGNMIKAGLGMLLFATIINGMTFFNLSIAMQQMILGSIFVIGMAALSRVKKRA